MILVLGRIAVFEDFAVLRPSSTPKLALTQFVDWFILFSAARLIAHGKSVML